MPIARRLWPTLVTLLLTLTTCLLPLARADEVRPTEHPFLWRIEGEPEHYLFGTIHLADPRVTTLAPAVEEAFYASDELYTELAFDKMMAQLGTRLMLPKGQSLRDILPAELWDRLDALLEGRGMRMASFDRFQVWGFYLILSTLDLSKSLADGPPLDMFLYDEAINMGMETGGLETLEEQLSVFADASREDQIHLIEVALEQLEESAAGEATEELIQAYLSGSEEGLQTLVGESAGDDDPIQAALMERLLPLRNHRMADRIDTHLQDHPARRHFFAVGSAHMPGAEGVVELLRQKGYTVERIGAPPASATPDVATLLREMEELRRAIDRLNERVSALEQTRARPRRERYQWR